MNHSNPAITTIIRSGGTIPQKSSSLSHTEQQALNSLPASASRKRHRETEYEQDTNNIMMIETRESDARDSNEVTNTEMNEDNGDIIVRGLRLEAIFHPKFDNERKKKGQRRKGKGADKNTDSSSDTRSAMLRKLGLGKICAGEGSRTDHANENNTNGNSNKTVVGEGTGHLEVSLKHSGSLVLWSGSTRYYSKNCACNEFTRTAEILLRQRFEMVRKAMASSPGSINNDQHCYRSYEDCSRFVSYNRYTIAFEVVTAEILGDHGQIPNLDYIVVTAVADRSQERFLSTTEVLEFCHRFRLPHNDVWTFFPPSTSEINNGNENPSSAESLFEIYDNSLRENGYTENTVQTLTNIADVYIPSPIPHSIYQGSICEGFIVRYIEDGVDDSTNARQQLEGLAKVACDILKEVPPYPTSPSSKVHDPDDCKSDPILNADLRTLYQSISCNGNGKSKNSPQNVNFQRQRAAQFSEKLKTLLREGNKYENTTDGYVVNNNNEDENKNNDNERQMKQPRLQRNDLKRIVESEKQGGATTTRTSIKKKPMGSLRNYHLPKLTKNLLESRDRETKRIANLLQTLDGLGCPVKYTWLEKHENGNDDSWKSTNESHKPKNRLYCMIHVHNDSTFFKFQSAQSPSEMTLFRGFCVELLLSSSKMKKEQINWGDENSNALGVKDYKDDEQLWKPNPRPPTLYNAVGPSGAPLMLKMKLLPYMVRTFICRNLLSTILQKGPEEFERIAIRLLEMWNMSSAALERWLPFFRGWALYALAEESRIRTEENSIHSEDKNLSDITDNKKHSTKNGDMILGLGPLTNFSYLRHLEHFTKLYENGEFRTVPSTASLTSPELQTFVCFTSQSTEVSSALANHFATFFRNNRKNEDEKMLNIESNMIVCSLGEAAKNRRSKSCIAYANVGDLTKGIKKFISDKKMTKRSILILYGSNKDEIIALPSSVTDEVSNEKRPPSWMDIPSEGDRKRLVGLWKTWKKFPCAERIELARCVVELQPKKEDSTVAIITSMRDNEGIIDKIQAIGKSLVDQEIKQQLDPNRGGILVFFPGIPGCGKSSLLESSTSILEEQMRSRNKEKGDLYDRAINIKEGDKIGKSFWNIIEDLLSDDDVGNGKSSTLVIADKNAPPASWAKLGQIGNETNGIMLPVLPDYSVLETTTIMGSIQPDGTLLPHASHFYPFSLKFLAVSLFRVLCRPSGEHVGKLDSGFSMACMVVVQFFSFYRYIGADTFQEILSEKLNEDGLRSNKILNPVELPFLTASARIQPLPEDLKNLLEEALQVRHGHDKKREFKVKKDNVQMIELERRMRSVIERHKDTIRSMTVNIDDSRNSFAVQIMDRIGCLNTKTDSIIQRTFVDSSSEIDVSKSIKLVSLDIDRMKVHEILQKHNKSGDLKNFFTFIESLSQLSPSLESKDETGDFDIIDANEAVRDERKTEIYSAPNFIENTHVTMAFAGENNSVETLMSNFRHLQGREVMISVSGLLWSNTNAALAIKLATSTVGEDSVSIPLCENSFAHITVWCATDVKASISNQLPTLVESGKGSRVDFTPEDVLIGRLSFWNRENEPFIV